MQTQMFSRGDWVKLKNGKGLRLVYNFSYHPHGSTVEFANGVTANADECEATGHYTDSLYLSRRMRALSLDRDKHCKPVDMLEVAP